MLDYMIANGYINPAVQKAFIRNINGTIEHNQLLQEVVSHARRNHKTVHITFFDLKDAFGSISHSLIDHVLTRYHIPDNVKTYINNLYSNLSGSVVGPDWKSERFVFKRGVFQGDPLSPTIFICIFNPLLEYILSEKKHGYHLDKDTPIISTPFADDFNIITSNSRSHQRILNNVEKFANTMNLILEPTKCKSLSISSGCSKVIEFKLSNQTITSIESSPEKFLGSQITFSGKQSDIYSFVHDGINTTLENIDKSLIRDEYKVKVYSQYVLPAVRFKLTVHELTNTNLNKLDSLSDRYLKKWLHIPPCGTLAAIHSDEGLGIKSLSHLFKESHAVSHATSRLKADSQVNTALDSRVAREREYVRKGSTSTYCEDHFQNCNNLEDQTTHSPSDIASVKKRVKLSVKEEVQSNWSDHIKTLVVQGRFLEILNIENSSITWKSIAYNLPRNILQFAINASIDTLATNANLRRWGKRSNAKCSICQQRETLHHTLNNCEEMLDRYKWRHDSILNYLHCTIKDHLLPDYDIYTDLPSMYHGATTIPLDIIITTLRPDLVIVNRTLKKLVLFELSVPFEVNIDATHTRKIDRYRQLISDIEENGYSVKYYAVEIGSRAFISKENMARIKSLIKDTSQGLKYNHVKSAICKIVLTASFVIFHAKYERSWVDPNYVTFSHSS